MIEIKSYIFLALILTAAFFFLYTDYYTSSTKKYKYKSWYLVVSKVGLTTGQSQQSKEKTLHLPKPPGLIHFIWVQILLISNLLGNCTLTLINSDTSVLYFVALENRTE